MNTSTSGLRLAANALVDLHLHTTASDGRWTLEALFDILIREQFSLAAVTDHDRADTAAAVQQMAQEKHLPVLVGVEMSATWMGELTDLLCYGFEPGQNPLNDLAQDLLRRQQENSREVCENLQRQGCRFPPGALESVLAIPSSRQPFAIVDLLEENGYGRGNPSAGQMLMAAGCAFATHQPAAVVEAAQRSGAVCLLAHPGRGDGFVTYDERLLDQFRQEAPVDGLEVYYPLHTPTQTALYKEYAQRHHLLVSAGSDSHKPEKPPIKYPAGCCRDLLERLGVSVVQAAP
jgi:3',5'-nucleoside bisphosphate phosphatase